MGLTARVLVGFLVLGAASGGSEGIDPAAVRQVVAATVFIKVKQAFEDQQQSSSGTGFFVTADGYLLTNWHVVADRMTINQMGQQREVRAEARLTVVVDSGSAAERELPALVVVRNREYDLALLQVGYSPKMFIDISEIPDVAITDQVWTVGFPYGSLLAKERQRDPNVAANPEITLTTGLVTSLRRDGHSEPVFFQTDTAINPGNSGGPMLDAQGRLVGVATAGIPGGDGLGFAISGHRLRHFLTYHTVAISFRPSAIPDPPQPIQVSVRPLLPMTTIVSGEVRFWGAGISSQVFALEPAGRGLETVIDLPGLTQRLDSTASYLASVTIRNSQRRPELVRKYRLHWSD